MKTPYIAGSCLAGGVIFLIHSFIPSWYHKHRNTQVIKKSYHNHTIMLTFDDGPDPRYTGHLLDLLAIHQIRATFFIVLDQAKQNEALIQRMIRDGHLVGFHSRSHHNPMFQSSRQTQKELKEGCDYLNSLGIYEIYYRPPWGLSNIATWHYLKKYHMNMVLWSMMAEDWSKKATVTSIIKKCRERVSDHTIICLHDAGENTGGAKAAPLKTLYALKTMIPEWKQQGYRFVLPYGQ